MSTSRLLLHRTSEDLLENFKKAPAHAVILEGPVGIGKTQLAHELLASLLGKNPPYSHVIQPVKGSIGIEAVRELIGVFQLKVPGRGNIKRIAIIEDAELMGIEAQNALLKILEEPPADSVLMLTSSRPQGLLPTIRSRVQVLHVLAPTAEQINGHFLQQGFDEKTVAAAILRGGSNVGAIKRLLSGEVDNSSVELVKKVLGSTSYDRMLLVDGLAKQKDAAQDFIDTLAAVAMASLEAAAKRGAATVERWRNILQSAHTAQQAFDKNGNAKIVLTELMLAL
jgi:DNA polymerase III delta prime subunit